MIKAVEQGDAFVEQIAQESSRGTNRRTINRVLRQIRDWWNAVNSGPSYEEINNKIQEQRLKYEVYRMRM